MQGVESHRSSMSRLTQAANQIQQEAGFSAPPRPSGFETMLFPMSWTQNLHFYINIHRVKQMLLSKAKYICQKKEKQQYIAVGIVRMVIET